MAETSPPDVAPAASPATDAAIPGLPPDWPQQATARVVDLVGQVRSKTAGPAIRVSRAVVYGLVAVILLFVALPLLVVGATRGIISIIDLWTDHEQAVWIAYAAIGGVLFLTGVILWSLRPRGAAHA